MKSVVLTLLASLSLPLLAEETVQYHFINNCKIEGGQTVVYHDDGSADVDFQFNDRGRGPMIHERYRLNGAGFLAELAVSGHSYLGAPVDETFTFADGVASWRNGVDDGSRRSAENAFYVSMNGTPAGYVELVRAALRQPKQTLALFPSGELTVRKIKTVDVPVGDGSQHANLYSVHGLGLTPDLIWLTDDQRYIGFSSDWSSLILAGWEKAMPTLQTEAEAIDRGFYAELSKQASRSQTRLLRVRNVRVLDVAAGTVGKPQDVWVRDGKFVSADEASTQHGGYDSIDAGNGVMMPGLWDMHSHLFDNSAVLNIAGGVTSIRDLGNKKEQLDDLIARIQSKAIAGPNVYRAALIDAESPFRAPTGVIVKSQDEALQQIDEIAKQGYPQIKLYSSVPPAWVESMAKRAHERGMRVSGHIPAFMSASEAVTAGYDEIQHVNMLFLNFLASKTDDTRTPLRFTLVGDKAGQLDLTSKPVQDFVALLKQHKTVLDPTVGIFVAMYSHEKGKPNPSIARVFDHFPLTVQRSQLAPEMDINDSNRAAYKQAAQALLKMVKLMYDAGVPIVAGTDDLAGFALHRELELYVEAGIPVADVLRIATLNAAAIAGAGASKGRIAPGYDADWVLLADNPLQDIQALRKARLVMKGDSLYEPGKIFAGMSIKGFTDGPAPAVVMAKP
ncbi:amidohydrolase family protein [Permianibacter sp. IMCC34836]|uniref:amidohydrolase family protein n=1 Tax=Permianibacter fluminis TaxID=2738515 RepID=UPI0015544F8C|nr:amidohydrolase family protein [Permianibacter fluminis]NQD36771.1 amidohydrolase family protein [Permianibacter fluminis]